MRRERPVIPRKVTEARSGRMSSDSSARADVAEKSARRSGATGASRSQAAAFRAGDGRVVIRVNVLSSMWIRGGSDKATSPVGPGTSRVAAGKGIPGIEVTASRRTG